MVGRRQLLLGAASSALAGCELQRWFEQPGRRIFRQYTAYKPSRSTIVAFARGGGSFFSLENPRDGSMGTSELCKVDLDTGKASTVRELGAAASVLAVSDDSAWIVLPAGPMGEPHLHCVSLVVGGLQKLFAVPQKTFIVADGQGAWTYRMGPRSTDLVRVTAAGVEAVMNNVFPGELTLAAQGVVVDQPDGLHFVTRGVPATRIAAAGIPVTSIGRQVMLARDGKLVELELPDGAHENAIGDVSQVPGRPCAAMFGGVLFASTDVSSAMPGDDRGGVALHFWEPENPGWDTAMDVMPGRLRYCAAHGVSFIVVTDTTVVSVS